MQRLDAAIGLLGQFARDARAARTLWGRRTPSLARQLAEAAVLRLGPGRLGLSEYHDYRLARPELRLADKRAYVGWRGEPRLDRCNDPRWHVYADDKVLLDRLLRDAGLPRPELQAVYRSPLEPGPDTAVLSTPRALADWLLGEARLPLFVKPAHSGFGRGTHLIRERSAPARMLVMDDGQALPVDAFVDRLPNPKLRGTLLQTPLRPHAELAALQCQRLSTLRMMTLTLPGNAPLLYRAVWKVPRRCNIIDNYECGTTGNLLGQVDAASGRVLRVVQGHGMASRELDRHPDSGLPFAGTTLPDWSAAVAVVLRAAQLLPALRFQHWDIALTDAGAVPLEVNLFAAGGTELSQVVDGRGLLEHALLALNRHPPSSPPEPAPVAEPAPQHEA